MRVEANNAASRRWCDEWDAASGALLQQLTDVRPIDAEVRYYIDERQRLTMSNPKPKGLDLASDEEQRRWLEEAIAREAVIRRAWAKYELVVGQSIETHRAGARVRATFTERAEPGPTRLSKKV